MRAILPILSLLPFSLSAEELPKPPVMPDHSFAQTLLMLGLGMVFFYFVLYRPEQKKRRELETARERLKVGDRVLALGIVGTVHKLQKETVILKMVDDSKIEVVKAAISEVLPGGEPISAK